MKKYLKFGVFSFVVLVSIFFCRKAEHNKLQNVILLNNVEALADPSEGGFDCVNGCVDNGNGCYCYQWYPYFHEHYWWN